VIGLERRGALALLRLEHGKVNAIDVELLDALGTRLDEIEAASARAVVLTGMGSTFSAGVDLWRVLDEGRPYLERFVPLLRESLTRLFAFPRPVVAAVNGHAIAGGCVLACACDHRIMATGDARIGVPELRVGVPFPGIALEIMRVAAPVRLFNSLVYRGETLTPEKARQDGLIEEVVPEAALLERACQVAEELAAIPAETFAITKRQYRGPALARAELHAEESDVLVASTWASDEVMAAIRSHMERAVGKRPR